jgi:hypothetical protein
VGPDKRDLYRFPWSLNDNPIGWLEVTDACNLHCRGCYRQSLEGHKSLEQLKEEVLFLKRWRNCDNISIAGGEALLHPEIVETVEFIAHHGMKPFILSNGMALNRHLLDDLKEAGLMGIGFHVDSLQGRPGWKDRDEMGLCELRLSLAELVADVGGLPPAGFGITVYRENLEAVPDLVRWTLKNQKIVGSATFITYRSALASAAYHVGDKPLALSKGTLGYVSDDSPEDIGISSGDVYAILRRDFPQYEASAYLGGTQRHDSIKWLIGVLLCSDREILGAVGPKTVEFAQVIHHLLFGTYFVYSKQASVGKPALLLATLDPAIRRVLKWYLRNPLRLLFEPLRGISIGIVQAPDLLENGLIDHCDSCPDMTYWNGRLVYSCRLDEYRKFGGLVGVTPPWTAQGDGAGHTSMERRAKREM